MEVKITGLEEIGILIKDIHEKVDAITSPKEDQWFDNDQFAKYLKISKKTAQSYRDQGLVEFSQVGAKIYYRLSAIHKFLDSHTIKNRK